MKKLSDYTGEDAIIISGKIMAPMGEIIADKGAIEALQGENQLAAIGEIMREHSKAVTDILNAVSGGEYNGGNAGMYFLQIFTDFCKTFGDGDFFNSMATN